MEKTPVSKHKLLNIRKYESHESVQGGNSEKEESPSQLPCTQEGCETVDVVWDWNSPQAKQKFKKRNKRLLLHSPKTSFKRHTSNNSIQDIEKLKQELQALKDEIAIPENEECLALSPLQEDEFKNPFDNELHQSKEFDFFDESVDRELLLFSQRIESEMIDMSESPVPSTSCQTNQIYNKFENNVARLSNTGKPDTLSNIQQMNNIAKKEILSESSFTINSVNNLKTNNMNGLPRTKSENIVPPLHQESRSKVEFHRTHSFEMAHNEHPVVLSQKDMQEIERKRQEALAKRELKRKQESITSPSRCSFEEIEQKRRQAVAKREAKRQQEIIERKRQEALKRLEISRKKNAKFVKSSLTNRLN